MLNSLKGCTLLTKGSVKDIYSLESTPEKLHFVFSNRISVFDYGALKEEIPERGLYLAQFAQKVFEDLKLPSLYTGASPLGLNALSMQACQHPKLTQSSPNNELSFVPLEVIFRWGVPEGSSLLKKGHSLFEKFSQVKIDYSTKLESFDRALSEEEAQSLLPKDLKLEKISEFTKGIAQTLKDYFLKCGLTLWDGKVEIAYNAKTQELFLIDAITPDELRLTLEDFPKTPLSKELLRRWYKKTLWPQHLNESKKQDPHNWKSAAIAPPAMGAWRLKQIQNLYKALLQCLQEQNPQSLITWLQEETLSPKVYVSGEGGRERALKWKLQNEGCQIVNTLAGADAVLVSNDGELAQGLINELQSNGTWAIGPTKEAAHIEWSKEFGKEIATLAQIPIPQWTHDPQEARK
jgi:phosphoribosylaminoimidazole-succinocarboxamide synthase